MSPSIPHVAIQSALIALALCAPLPAAAAIVSFTGVEMNDTPPPAPSALCSPGQVRVAFSPGTATVSGSSNFGAFAPSLAHCLTLPPTSYTGGAFDFAFAAGDDLFGTYSGFFTPSGVANVLNNTVDFIVTGGTGRFLGASGAFQGVGTLDRNFARPLNRSVFSGSLDLPAVPEPAAWMSMILGFGLAGAALRRRPITLAG
ncbi:PEPxxWA-CTERM sorting domain-containing protein [Phenylobacterium sp.]|uniref:PEPxxWA-CTERM sorting domain-containing protein n=1 Tax=Phenylobacterium sp. TaxID=1871053 RepID=UPI00374C99CA